MWKFEKSANDYHVAMKKIVSMGFDPLDYVHHNPVFNGHVNIARFLALYELYKRTLGLNGHIAEVGIWKGASFLFLAKLAEIFEPRSYTEVHGFDWFKGMAPSAAETDIKPASYQGDYETLMSLIEIQDLSHVAKVFKLDVTTELDAFLEAHPHRYRLVFLDAGTHAVVSAALPRFWERLNSGGILVLDQYNDPRAQGETLATFECLPGARVETFPWTRQPAAFIVKP